MHSELEWGIWFGGIPLDFLGIVDLKNLEKAKKIFKGHTKDKKKMYYKIRTSQIKKSFFLNNNFDYGSLLLYHKVFGIKELQTYGV